MPAVVMQLAPIPTLTDAVRRTPWPAALVMLAQCMHVLEDGLALAGPSDRPGVALALAFLTLAQNSLLSVWTSQWSVHSVVCLATTAVFCFSTLLIE